MCHVQYVDAHLIVTSLGVSVQGAFRVVVQLLALVDLQGTHLRGRTWTLLLAQH